MNIKKPINKRIVDKPIFNVREINKAYVDYFIKNNIDFNYSNNGIAVITKDAVKDDKQYLNDLEKAYTDCDLNSIY